MNIFALHSSPKITAKWHADKHVVKMVLETTQLLTNAYYISIAREAKGPLDPSERKKILLELFATFPREEPYELTHENHPCTIWTAKCIENWEWLLKLGMELCREYTFRYNKQHACAPLLQWMSNHHPVLPESSTSQTTPFPMVMPEEFQITEDPITNYRIYYTFSKQEILKWTKREEPFFVRSYHWRYQHAI